MRKDELNVLKSLIAGGIPARLAKANTRWPEVRKELDAGIAPDAIARSVAPTFLPLLPLLPVLPVVDPGTVVSGALDAAGKLIGLVFPPPPPLPAGFSCENELTNCTPVFIGTIGAGDLMKISVSNNGTLPFDTSGSVEVLADPPIPTPPGAVGRTPTIAGNNEIVVSGPITIWLHLKGQEDACDVKVTVFPKGK